MQTDREIYGQTEPKNACKLIYGKGVNVNEANECLSIIWTCFLIIAKNGPAMIGMLFHLLMTRNGAGLYLALSLKWMVQRHKDACQKWRLRLEYTYLLLDKFITSRISPEITKKGRILTSFSVTKRSRGDKILLSLEMELRKFSINIFMCLELIFCLVSDIIWEIEVRTCNVGKDIYKLLHLKSLLMSQT